VIVLDASAAIEMLLRTLTGRLVETRIFSSGESLHAPHLVDLEIAHVLRRQPFGYSYTPRTFAFSCAIGLSPSAFL